MRALPVALSFLLLAGCASDEPSAGGPSDPGDVEIVDIHGIALDPTDASVLYVATHRGLLRLDDDTTWSYVGGARDDLMGFTAHPTDPQTFWASGHPRLGGNLGVIRSTDGGTTWTPIGAPGVDFHAMAVSAADPQRLYGSWHGEVMRSDDGGVTWATIGQHPVTGFGTHPTDRDIVYAATSRSLLKSVDAGATWSQLGTVAPIGVAVDPNSPSTLYLGSAHLIRKSTDEGRWEPTGQPRGGAGTVAFLAMHAGTPGLLYAAVYEKGIYKSTDGGATWDVVLAPAR